MNMTHKIKYRLALAAAVVTAGVFGLSGPSLYAQGRNDTIVITGQAVPGGGTFSSNLPIVNASMNAAGQVVFQATNLNGTPGGSTDDDGFFLGNGGAISQIFREGQTVPGGNGVYSFFDGGTHLDNSGRVGILSTLGGTSGGTLDDVGLFLGNGTNTTLIARENQTVPDSGTISSFNNFFSNESGRFAFAANLTGTSGGTTDNKGIFSGNGGTFTEVARKGESALGNGTFSSLSLHSFNESGYSLFSANMIGTTGGSTDNAGLFVGNGGTIEQIARKGQLAADGNGFYSSISTDPFGGGFNDSGRAVFSAFMTGTSGGTSDDFGIFAGEGGAPVSKIVREGQTEPGGNGSFSNFLSPQLNNAGQVVVSASLIGTSGGTLDDSGVFLGDGSSLIQIAREGQTAPDGNGTFGNLAGPALAKLNNKGNVVFRSDLIGTSGGSTDNEAFYVGDGIDLLQIVRKGESMFGSTVVTMAFGLTDVINDNGQVLYSAFLNNGNNVIQRWTPDLHWRVNSGGSFETAANWTLGLGPASVHDVFIDSAASLTVTGPATNRSVNSLQVGGGTGQAQFVLQNGAVLSAANGVTVANKGTLTGDGVIAGNVTTNLGGTILADNLTVTNTITNNGVIRGNGFVQGNIVNNAGGKIRALGGDSLHLAGPGLSNAGLIEINDSELQIDGPVNNQASTGLISVRNGSLIADAGITNQGSMAMTLGASTVQGDINNTGTIQVSGGAHATFFDDLTQNGVMQVAAVGNTNSTAVILGSFTGSGGFVGGGDVFVLGDLRPGNSPDSVLYDGNLFLGSSTNTLIELAGEGVGEFDQLLVSGDLNLDGNLSVSLIDGFTLSKGDFFLIGNIGGDLTGKFNSLDEGSLVGSFGGLDLFITYEAGDLNDIALMASAVPEPGSLIFVSLVGIALLSRRTRRCKVA